MKKQVLILIALFFSSALLAQNPGTIKGSVIDQDTKETLIGATVYIEVGGEIMGTTTDADGKFTIKPVPPGLYTLFLSYVGYHKLVIGDVRVLPDQIRFEDTLAMIPTAIEIEGGEVFSTSKKRLFNKDEPTKLTILQDEIAQRADGKNLKQMVSNIGDGVTQGSDGELFFRGTRATSFDYYVDGIKVSGTSQVNIPSRAISSLSVYSGGIPAKYGDITGGVIIIETMTYGELYRKWKAHNM